MSTHDDRTPTGGDDPEPLKTWTRRRNSPGGYRRRRHERHRQIRFWGEPDDLPEVADDMRLTDDPDAVPRSLGEPPLPGRESVALHYFAAVYDRAVTMAGAIAAAGGLIDPERLTEHRGD